MRIFCQNKIKIKKALCLITAHWQLLLEAQIFSLDSFSKLRHALALFGTGLLCRISLPWPLTTAWSGTSWLVTRVLSSGTLPVLSFCMGVLNKPHPSKPYLKDRSMSKLSLFLAASSFNFSTTSGSVWQCDPVDSKVELRHSSHWWQFHKVST